MPRFIRYSEIHPTGHPETRLETPKNTVKKAPPPDAFYGEDALQILRKDNHNTSGLPGKILYYLPKKPPTYFRHFPQALLALSASEFEFWVAERLRRELQLDVVLTKQSDDKGCDVIAFYSTNDGEKRMIVSAKKYKDKVRAPQLDELIKKTKEYWKPDAYMLIAPCPLSSGVNALQETFTEFGGLDVLLVDESIISRPFSWPTPKGLIKQTPTNQSNKPRFKRFGET